MVKDEELKVVAESEVIALLVFDEMTERTK